MHVQPRVSSKSQSLPMVVLVLLVMVVAVTVPASRASAFQMPAYEGFSSDTFTLGVHETLSLPVLDESIAAVELFTDAGAPDNAPDAPVVTVPAPGVAGPLVVAMFFGGRRRRRNA